MTIQFTITFTRYLNYQRHRSTPMFIMAESFSKAVEQAEIYLAGLKSGNSNAEFEIESIIANGFNSQKFEGNDPVYIFSKIDNEGKSWDLMEWSESNPAIVWKNA